MAFWCLSFATILLVGVNRVQNCLRGMSVLPYDNSASAWVTDGTGTVCVSGVLARRKNSMLRILLADDHDSGRETIAAYLEAEGFDTVARARDVEQSLRLIAEGGRFDLILADSQLPGIDGLAGLAHLIAANSPYPVALIAGDICPEVAATALEMGAKGVVSKSSGSRSMVASVKAMLAAEVLAPGNLTRPNPDNPLSQRELDVLQGICAGKSNKELARDIGLQEVTVKLHVKTMSRKLQAKNRTHAAMIARDMKLV